MSQTKPKGRLFGRARPSVRSQGPLTQESLREWLIVDLARRLQIPPAAVDPTKTFEAYGLDSRVAVQVSGALEKVVERRLSPALLYDHQTIDALSAFLASELHLAPTA